MSWRGQTRHKFVSYWRWCLFNLGHEEFQEGEKYLGGDPKARTGEVTKLLFYFLFSSLSFHLIFASATQGWTEKGDGNIPHGESCRTTKKCGQWEFWGCWLSKTSEPVTQRNSPFISFLSCIHLSMFAFDADLERKTLNWTQRCPITSLVNPGFASQ